MRKINSIWKFEPSIERDFLMADSKYWIKFVILPRSDQKRVEIKLARGIEQIINFLRGGRFWITALDFSFGPDLGHKFNIFTIISGGGGVNLTWKMKHMQFFIVVKFEFIISLYLVPGYTREATISNSQNKWQFFNFLFSISIENHRHWRD